MNEGRVSHIQTVTVTMTDSSDSIMRSHENGISKLGYNTTTEVTARPRAVPTASPHETCGGPIRPLERPARTHAHRIVSSHKAASRRGTAHQHDTQHACTQFESLKTVCGCSLVSRPKEIVICQDRLRTTRN